MSLSRFTTRIAAVATTGAVALMVGLATLTVTVTAVTVMAVTVVGCGGGQAKAVSLKPLEERRARAIIEEAIQSSGEKPVQPRVIDVGGKELAEDMAIEGGTYGVAYVTREEERALAGAIPARDPEQQDLQLVRGASGEVVLVVWEQHYRFDESTEHTATAVTAERKLRRDVADFVLHVVKQGKGK